MSLFGTTNTAANVRRRKSFPIRTYLILLNRFSYGFNVISSLIPVNVAPTWSLTFPRAMWSTLLIAMVEVLISRFVSSILVMASMTMYAVC